MAVSSLRRIDSALRCITLLVVWSGCGGTAAPSDRGDIEFRGRVLDILTTAYPTRGFVAGKAPDLVLLGDTEFGLQNLRARFDASTRTEADLVALVREHFGAGLAAMDAASQPLPAWEVAQRRLRPQLTPAEYLERAPLPHRAFAGGLLQTIVVDSEDTYQYVSAEDLERWGVSFDDASAVAIRNLHEASQGIAFDSGDGPDKFLALETGDSYDAARILVPELRELAARHLGSPFLAAVPNRGLLILWSKDSSQDLHERIRGNVSDDFAGQPYPLTAVVLEVSPSGVTESRPW